ncbi:FmdB family zinc ribbon protein [Actinomadura macra]|uniref:FmdB family zinc ribbon protein n=1 Tax=Actinomadura macra TaxID=46164 RepID=UPI00082B2AC5|nr:zinc ribbon domain-containing protein [Actinomadura macra]
MPIYEFRCRSGHRTEVLQPYDDSAPTCPHCGETTARVPSAPAVLSGTTTLPAAASMPQTWRGTHDGNREYIHHLQQVNEQRTRLEAEHPELAGDRRPVLAHEGPYEVTPLRQGDQPIATGDHARHAHPHGHGHGRPSGPSTTSP